MMSEKNNLEVTAEEETALTEDAPEADEIQAEDVLAAEEVQEDATESEEDIADTDTNDEEPETDIDTESEGPEKKKPMLQIPVIISLCIVAAALLVYFVFTAFFMKEPDSRIFWSGPEVWEGEYEDVTYYYMFDKDGELKAYADSLEFTTTYDKASDKDGRTLQLNMQIGNFPAFDYYTYEYPAVTYTISGSRILGNQVLKAKYTDPQTNEEVEFTLKQSKKSNIKNPLEAPKDFEGNEKLVGTWNGHIYNNNIDIRLIIEDDGTASLQQSVVGDKNAIHYNGIYTVEDSTMNFTYYFSDNIVVPVEYISDGDYLNFMGYIFTREGSEAEATSDQLLIP